MTEIIEGTARDVTETAVVIHDQPRTVQAFDAPTQDPLRALGRMDDAAFRSEVTAIVQGTERMMQLQREMLRDKVDYDIIPGTTKPTLLQPGAERLCMFHRLIPEHVQTVTVTPVPGHADRIDVDTTTLLHLGSLDGPVVGFAKASASSYEDRYRWRTSERVCPKCQKPAIIKGNPQYAPRTHGREGDVLPGYQQGGWLCWKKKDGCGAQFADNDLAITGQATGKVEYDEPHSLRNTIIQMSAKRGLVGATRHTLGITDLFTQDVEDLPPLDMAPPMPSEPAAAPAPTQAPAAAKPAARSQPKAQAAATPAPAPSGKGELVFDGPVTQVDDGTRQTPDGRVFRFAIKVGNSKHNVELWGDAAVAVAGSGIALEDTVKVTGVRTEEDWPGRGDKPMKKVIKQVTRVEVNGREIPLGDALPPEPVEQMPEPFDFDGPAAPVERVRLHGDPSGTADITGQLADAKWDTTPKGAAFLSLEVEPDPGQYVVIAMSEADANEQIVGDDGLVLLPLGTVVRVMGGWNKTGQVLVAAIVTQA